MKQEHKVRLRDFPTDNPKNSIKYYWCTCGWAGAIFDDTVEAAEQEAKEHERSH